MNGYEAYCTYISLKAHFCSEAYDFHKYGRFKPKVSTYHLRKDLPFFEKLARKFNNENDLVEYIVSQLKNKPNLWIGAMFDEEAEERHNSRLKSIQSMRHNLESSTRMLTEQSEYKATNIGFLFVVPKDGRHPKFLSMLLQRKITEETFLCYDRVMGFTNRWDERMKHDPIWEDMSLRLRKYSSFLNIDEDKVREEILSTIEKTMI